MVESDAGRRIDERLADWTARLDRVEAKQRQPAPVTRRVTDAAPYLLFLPSPSGYTIGEHDGPVPSAGETIEVAGHGGSYTVVKVVRSPLPGDSRLCAYLQLT